MIKRSSAVHDGVFHSDEITACALLVIFDCIDIDKIIRTRDENRLNECEYVCDVGGEYNPTTKKFDHHQVDYEGPLSSAGMVLKYLKEQNVINDDLYKFLDKEIISGIDKEDNGQDIVPQGICSFSDIISYFTPIAYDCSSQEEKRAFFAAVHFTVDHLRRMIDRFQYNLKSKNVVKTVMSQSKNVLIFSKALPWLDNFFSLGGEKHPALFVIMPSKKHWKLRGVPPSLSDKMNVRCPLPKSWAGLHEKQLEKITNIPGAIFCHKGRFISIWQTKEAALMAFDQVMKIKE